MIEKPLTRAEEVELDAYGELVMFEPMPPRAAELWYREIMYGRKSRAMDRLGLLTRSWWSEPLLRIRYAIEDAREPGSGWISAIWRPLVACRECYSYFVRPRFSRKPCPCCGARDARPSS